MTAQEFQNIYPYIQEWIDNTLQTHKAKAAPVISMGLKRLPNYFSREVLTAAKFVLVDTIPVPPLASFGLVQFGSFENGNYGGITYLDTFFIKKGCESESLFFHELIHILQWRMLGAEQFMKNYADGLERYGYDDSPLEKMAYILASAFDKDPTSFDIEKIVKEELKRLYP